MKQQQIELLDQLIEKIEMYQEIEDWRPYYFGEIFATKSNCTYALAAYEDSIDAARALQDAVLPEWELTHMGQHENGWMVAIARLGPPTSHEGIHVSSPGRAWLLAILYAIRSINSRGSSE